jgi:diacylglycerol kinase family enzyme
MYHYIYESFLTDPKYAKQLSAIENRLTDLGIYGSVHRLALFKTMKGTVTDAVRRGAKTVVVVGDNASVAKAIDAVAEFPNVTFGIVPVGDKNNEIAGLLGIGDALGACDILSARLIEELDLGKVNNRHFLTTLRVGGSATAECDGRYTVSPVGKGEICVSNLDSGAVGGDPRDGRFETTVAGKAQGFFRRFSSANAGAGMSIFPTEKVVLRPTENGPLKAYADGQEISEAELRVEILPKRLKVIVGKARQI